MTPAIKCRLLYETELAPGELAKLRPQRVDVDGDHSRDDVASFRGEHIFTVEPARDVDILNVLVRDRNQLPAAYPATVFNKTPRQSFLLDVCAPDDFVLVVKNCSAALTRKFKAEVHGLCVLKMGTQ